MCIFNWTESELEVKVLGIGSNNSKATKKEDPLQDFDPEAYYEMIKVGKHLKKRRREEALRYVLATKYPTTLTIF